MNGNHPDLEVADCTTSAAREIWISLRQWTLTIEWADLFGSPNLTGQYLAAGGASSWRGAEFDILFQERFLKGARAPLSG